MGYQGAAWLERPEREKEEDPAKLYKALGLKDGLAVADIGAGSGYHTFRMAKQVGPTGKVLAVDVQPQMLAIIKQRAKKEGVKNVEPVKGTQTDPKLPAGAVDLILMVDVYHEFAQPYEMTKKLVEALKPGGRLVFVEFRLEDPKVYIKLVHKMTERQVLKEMSLFPEMEHTKTDSSLPWQHVVIFTKKEAK
jgi:ubiquinone/menaquinone biosynthesis C-methylase UbiE